MSRNLTKPVMVSLAPEETDANVEVLILANFQSQRSLSHAAMQLPSHKHKAAEDIVFKMLPCLSNEYNDTRKNAILDVKDDHAKEVEQSKYVQKHWNENSTPNAFEGEQQQLANEVQRRIDALNTVYTEDGVKEVVQSLKRSKHLKLHELQNPFTTFLMIHTYSSQNSKGDRKLQKGMVFYRYHSESEKFDLIYGVASEDSKFDPCRHKCLGAAGLGSFAAGVSALVASASSWSVPAWIPAWLPALLPVAGVVCIVIGIIAVCLAYWDYNRCAAIHNKNVVNEHFHSLFYEAKAAMRVMNESDLRMSENNPTKSAPR